MIYVKPLTHTTAVVEQLAKTTAIKARKSVDGDSPRGTHFRGEFYKDVDMRPRITDCRSHLASTCLLTPYLYHDLEVTVLYRNLYQGRLSVREVARHDALIEAPWPNFEIWINSISVIALTRPWPQKLATPTNLHPHRIFLHKSGIQSCRGGRDSAL